MVNKKKVDSTTSAVNEDEIIIESKTVISGATIKQQTLPEHEKQATTDNVLKTRH